MDRANYALADYLARQGYPLHLVAYRVDRPLLAYPNVHFHCVPKPANAYLLGSPLLSRVGQFWANWIRHCGGRVLVNGGNCAWGDVNWVHYVHAAYQPESAIGGWRRLKGTIVHHGFCRTERSALRQARVIFANSQRTREDLITRLELPDSRIQTVYYGIDATTFYPATPAERITLRQRFGWPLERPIVVFLGALGDRRKGFDTLFAAWRQLCTDPLWDADLVVIGAGAALPHWQQQIRQAGLVDRIHCLGFRTDVPDLLRAADCLVAPTRYEAYGLGVHEALCCGLPAIVSATAGVAERYPPNLSALLLANPEDVSLLVQRLQHWRQKQDDYRAAIDPFSQTLRQYGWDDMAEKMRCLMQI